MITYLYEWHSNNCQIVCQFNGTILFFFCRLTISYQQYHHMQLNEKEECDRRRTNGHLIIIYQDDIIIIITLSVDPIARNRKTIRSIHTQKSTNANYDRIESDKR